MQQRATSKRRYLALWLPFLSTDRIARQAARDGRERADKPLIVIARTGNALRLVGADRRARALGLVPGLAYGDARARVPALEIVEDDPGADQALIEKLADWCTRYTPVLAFDPPHGLVLEIAGSTHLFGGEQALDADLRARLARMGLNARTAIADTVPGARALARYGAGGIVVPGHQAQNLNPLPVAALESDDNTALALRRAGLMTLGDLATRPRKPLAARFSSALTLRLAEILGEIDTPITPRRTPPLFRTEMRFADPIGLMDDIIKALASLAADLALALTRHQQGGRHFCISFYRADGQMRCLDVFSAQPLRAPQTLMRLIEMRIEALADPIDPGFGFDMLALEALAGDEALPTQHRLDARPEGAVIAADLANRLTARLGPEAVSRFVPHDTHLPERAARMVPALTRTGPGELWSPGHLPPRPLFLLSPPEPVETLAQIPDGPPRRFRWRKAQHDIVLVEGPERIAPEWWRQSRDNRTRDYFRVEDTEGRRFWLFRYGLYGREGTDVRWFIHGLFP